jgi:hypothetical protein
MLDPIDVVELAIEFWSDLVSRSWDDSWFETYRSKCRIWITVVVGLGFEGLSDAVLQNVHGMHQPRPPHVHSPPLFQPVVGTKFSRRS